jgi:hypothetical protein
VVTRSPGPRRTRVGARRRGDLGWNIFSTRLGATAICVGRPINNDAQFEEGDLVGPRGLCGGGLRGLRLSVLGRGWQLRENQSGEQGSDKGSRNTHSGPSPEASGWCAFA